LAAQAGQWEWDVARDAMVMCEYAQRLLGLPGPASGESVRPHAEWLQRIAFHPDDGPRWRAELEAFLEGNTERYDAEWRVKHADGSCHWVRGRTACVRDTAGRPLRVAGSLLDIDAHKSSEAMGTFASGIAHDFNNVLGAILGYGEMALRDTPQGSRLRRDLDAILLAGERGRLLVDQLLASSRSTTGELLVASAPQALEGARATQ
jgi:signal transduction histidine kinase